MKRVLKALVIGLGLCGAHVQAGMMMRAEDMKEIHDALAGKEFKQPGDMVEKWVVLKAQMLDLGAKEMRETAEQFKNRSAAAKWNAVAAAKEDLAKQLRGLPIPPEMTKRMTHMHEWMKLKGEKMVAKAEQMRIIARQLQDKAANAKMLKIADEMDAMGKNIQKVAEKAAQSSKSTVAEMEIKEEVARG